MKDFIINIILILLFYCFSVFLQCFFCPNVQLVAGPSEYIVRTGIGISDIAISKKYVELVQITIKTTLPIITN